MTAGVVVGRVGDSEGARLVDQAVAGEGVAEGRVIVLALADEVKLAVLADAEISARRNGSSLAACRLAEGIGGRARSDGGHRVDHLLTDKGEHFGIFLLNRLGEEFDLFVCDRLRLFKAMRAKSRFRSRNGVCIFLAEQIGKRHFYIFEHI